MDKDKIIAFLKNDDEDFDRREVEQWIAKNRVEFKRIKYVWETAGIHTEEDPDIEKAWRRVNPENRNNTRNKKKKLKIQTTRFQRIAAVLVLAVSIGFIIYQQYARVNRTETALLEVKNDSDNVRKVQLNDGTEVWLNACFKNTISKGVRYKDQGSVFRGRGLF